MESSEVYEINNNIISWELVKEVPPEAIPDPKPQALKERPYSLEGITYKIKPPTLSAALYITLNHDENDNLLECFISTKDASKREYLDAITRLVSAIFRRTNEPHFIAQELKEIASPDAYWDKGTFVSSTMAHIGAVLEHHMEQLGAVTTRDREMAQIPEICVDCE